MARNNYPGAKTEKGVIAAFNCRHPCGGHVVLYDRKAGADIGVKLPASTTGRWILVHRPSGNCAWPFDSLQQAREFTRKAAKGEDPLGILPRTTPKTSAEKSADEFLKEGSVVTPVRTPPKSKPADPPPPAAKDNHASRITHHESPLPPPADFHLDFKRRMAEKFTPEVIVQKLDDLLNALKPVALQNLDSGEKETVDVPDWMAREKAIRLVVEMNEGKAKERPDTKEPVKRSWEDLNKMLKSSPKARSFMRQHLEDLERSTSVTTTDAHAHGTAKR